MNDPISRRQLLRGGGVIAVGLVAPRWLASVARADVVRGRANSDTILVVCQLSGGNDGLNTVVPYADADYYRLRPNLAIADGRSLKLDDKMGLHPALAGLHTLYGEGKVAILQNVGYPAPNRSHFRSMEIWQSASPDGGLKHGWIGRHFDARLKAGPLNPVVALGLSTEKPLALSGRDASIPCFASLTDLQNLVGDRQTEQMLREIQAMDERRADRQVVKQANRAALDAVSELNKRLRGVQPTGTYGNDAFGVGFRQIATLIAASPATRVVYFNVGGFDTHARQAETHERLLKGFGDAVLAFQREMEALGKAKNVVVLAFSEFGRRVRENGSAGTDHGAAAPMFLIGQSVKGGLHGAPPDLQNLQDGDLRMATDFREVYAATLEDWLGGDSEPVLGGRFKPVTVFR